MLDFLNLYKLTMLLNTKSYYHPIRDILLSNEKNHFSKLQLQLSYTFSIFVMLSFIRCHPALATMLSHSSPLLFCMAPNKIHYLSITVQQQHIPRLKGFFPCVFISSFSNPENSLNMQSSKRKNKHRTSNYVKLCSGLFLLHSYVGG